MKIVKRKIKKLSAYDKNPRQIGEDAIAAVMASIVEHGQAKPIVVSEVGSPFENEVICAGHTTTLALTRLGIDDVDVVLHKFKDEAQFADYNIRDNKSAEFSNWDESVLSELVGDFDIDLSAMGFEIQDEDGIIESQDFKLPKGDKAAFKQITFVFSTVQLEFIDSVLTGVTGEEFDNQGNEHKKGNSIYSILKLWDEQKK